MLKFTMVIGCVIMIKGQTTTDFSTTESPEYNHPTISICNIYSSALSNCSSRNNSHKPKTQQFNNNNYSCNQHRYIYIKCLFQYIHHSKYSKYKHNNYHKSFNSQIFNKQYNFIISLKSSSPINDKYFYSSSNNSSHHPYHPSNNIHNTNNQHNYHTNIRISCKYHFTNQHNHISLKYDHPTISICNIYSPTLSICSSRNNSHKPKTQQFNNNNYSCNQHRYIYIKCLFQYIHHSKYSKYKHNNYHKSFNSHIFNKQHNFIFSLKSSSPINDNSALSNCSSRNNSHKPKTQQFNNNNYSCNQHRYIYIKCLFQYIHHSKYSKYKHNNYHKSFNSHIFNKQYNFIISLKSSSPINDKYFYSSSNNSSHHPYHPSNNIHNTNNQHNYHTNIRISCKYHFTNQHNHISLKYDHPTISICNIYSPTLSICSSRNNSHKPKNQQSNNNNYSSNHFSSSYFSNNNSSKYIYHHWSHVNKYNHLYKRTFNSSKNNQHNHKLCNITSIFSKYNNHYRWTNNNQHHNHLYKNIFTSFNKHHKHLCKNRHSFFYNNYNNHLYKNNYNSFDNNQQKHYNSSYNHQKIHLSPNNSTTNSFTFKLYCICSSSS
ncbi:hypothetical protein KOW79_009036 [Hemibagrus wyckioides]|uniref:Uncharacterized protein n=1 Tax=Hemibagrus wyckioides TaxID=337641 RepID=A0A9D3NRW7_9TELE|nr:hypothetical protein KOW79_009036 [Hemibagrus wyckioides]